ncbi:MAG TPA: 30S ribosomal protein S6 [Deltaproteobacteria bacterium]|nr:30S ribosomal protein S6 [Deltaproteobacteria bacterium]
MVIMTVPYMNKEVYMRYYETMVVFKYDLPEKSIDEVASKIEATIKEESGEILKAENWNKKTLSYKIDKDEYGIYRLWHYKSGEDAPDRLDKYFRITDGIIRFQTILMYKKDINLYEGKTEEPESENTAETEET